MKTHMKDLITRIALLLLLAGAAFPAVAHEAQTGMVYEPFCCNGDANTGDCFQIPSETVKAGPDGYQVTLRPGDHPLVTAPQSWIVPYKDARPATDGAFHACLFPKETDMRCLYAPGQGF